MFAWGSSFLSRSMRSCFLCCDFFSSPSFEIALVLEQILFLGGVASWGGSGNN
jgi:hypothetical protein